MNDAQHEQEQLHKIYVLQRRLQQHYEAMEAIVRAVAESKPFQGEGYCECLFCDLPDGETHEPSCIVTKARALVEQAKERDQ